MQKEEEEVSMAICGETTCQLETYKFCQCGSYITCGFGLLTLRELIPWTGSATARKPNCCDATQIVQGN